MEPYLGQIFLFAGNFVPRSFHECNGALISIEFNQQLFAILGNRYGGDGLRTFALPKMAPLENKTQDGSSQKSACTYIICIDGSYPAAS